MTTVTDSPLLSNAQPIRRDWVDDTCHCLCGRDSWSIRTARYARGKVVLLLPYDATGYKTRAMRLASALRMRWSYSEGAYIASPVRVRRFERLMSEGWDAFACSGTLVRPDSPAAEVLS